METLSLVSENSGGTTTIKGRQKSVSIVSGDESGNVAWQISADNFTKAGQRDEALINIAVGDFIWSGSAKDLVKRLKLREKN